MGVGCSSSSSCSNRQQQAAACAAAARAEAAAEAADEAVCAQPRVRTLKTANHNGWQRGERLDGRDAVQQRVAGAADKADEADDEALCWGRQQRQTAKTATAGGGGSRWRHEQQKVGGGTVGRSCLPRTVGGP
jgi:hypothetical protein